MSAGEQSMYLDAISKVPYHYSDFYLQRFHLQIISG